MPKMRARIPILLIIILILLTLTYRLITFLQIFFEHSGIALTDAEILAAHEQQSPDPREQHIPKIIHQVFHDWKNASMPNNWEGVRKTCIKHNPGWEYHLWTLESSREFIVNNYPQFLSTYDGYRFPIQR